MELVEHDNPIKIGGSLAIEHLYIFYSKLLNTFSSLSDKFLKHFCFLLAYSIKLDDLESATKLLIEGL